MPQTTALRLTGAIETFIAAMDKPRDSPEVEAAVAQVREWAGTTIEWSDDQGGTLYAHAVGIRFELSYKKVWSIAFYLKGDEEYQPFTHLGLLIDGLENAVDQGGSRAALGAPFDDAYRNDSYVLENGAEMFLRGAKDGSLTYLVLRDEGAAARRKLLRKLETRAKRAAGAGPARVDVHDEDGILSIVDPSTYQGFVGNWDFDSLTDHLASEMNAAHALVWATGSESHGEWGVEFRERASRRKVFREATGTIEVTNGTLQVVNYTELTQLAENESLSLPLAGGTHWSIDLANGTYALRLRQLFDPEDLDSNNEGVFEVVYKKVTNPKDAESVIAPLWWST